MDESIELLDPEKEFIKFLAMETPSFYWGRAPGKQVNSKTGEELPFVDGTSYNILIKDWYGGFILELSKFSTSGKIVIGFTPRVLLENAPGFKLQSKTEKYTKDPAGNLIGNIQNIKVILADYLPEDLFVFFREENDRSGVPYMVGKIV